MKYFLALTFLFFTICSHAQVKIGDNPNTINAASILEMEDTTRGVLVTRMTTAQRNAIASPPSGLQIYNITTNTMDVFRSDHWESTTYANTDENLVYVYSMDDLPAPSGSSITLDANSMYIFRGIIDISPYYLELNGANLQGIDPARDGVQSSVSGAILRSTDVSVFMQDLVVIPLSGTTSAYDFKDASGTKFCNLFSGNSVIEIGIPSLGVGQISGFIAATIVKNYWNCADGLKVDGNMGKFACAYTFITNLTTGAGIEFLGSLVIDDIDLSNNYFIYSGNTGVKLNPSAQVDRGRLTTNMFRDVGTVLSGVTPYDIGWNMSQNTNIPDTRAYGYIFTNSNAESTNFLTNNTYAKVNGTTSSVKLLKFESVMNNRLTYKGMEDIIANIFITVTGKSPSNDASLTLAVSKNGTAINNPNHSTGLMVNNQTFTLVLETEVDMSTDDYIEAVIKTTTGESSVAISDLQFRVRD
ncbi:hypothetical protein QYS49_00645 [Marivirga salinae]|uniref:Uncharacterized protein n=1 Tax=Marivirga salinarum TaxID=3059078 RepID=A0AA49J8P5_9BACT|nr:hypothetical protein [Marivirga sp. BDSF4-3]WKK75994.2 hypothetical protein QYS49_00645 [Marivirga sp. BDSF4-3]